jgi:ABC-type Fe3+-hydroxamate transport system substrate-binding protein
VRRDPDVILTSAATRTRMLTEPRWQTLRAVRARNIVVFDSTIINGPSARVGSSAAELARLLHPGAVR